MPGRKINIAVTGLNAIDSPGSGIPVIRALKESKLFRARIVGLSYESLEPGIFMHELVDKTYQIPLPSAGTEALLNRLEYIHKKENLHLIIPNFDSELFNFIRISDALRTKFQIRTFLPDMEQFESRQKVHLAAFGKKHKIKVPPSKVIYRIADLSSLKENFEYPLVIKGKYYDANIVYSLDQAKTAFNKICGKWGLPVIVQQFISGQEMNVTAIGDGKGKTMGCVVMRKQYITDKGKAWSGISINDRNLISLTSRLMKSTKWRGGLELKMVKNDSGEYYLLEINPRFPAWVYLAVGCGQNHPEQLVQMALGEKTTPYKKYAIGKFFVRYSYDMIVDIKEFEKISTLGEL